MSNKRLAIAVVILLLMLAGAAWSFLGPLRLPQITKELAAVMARLSPDAAVTPPSGKAPDDGHSPAQSGPTVFDVARISPEGTSVFAGRSEPFANVTILENGHAVGTTQADENGEWTFTTEHKFSGPDPQLALLAKPGTAPIEVPAATAEATIPGDNGETRKATAGAVTSRLLKNLEGMVADARGASQTNDVLSKGPAAALPANAKPPANVAAVGGSPAAQPPSGAEPGLHKSIPLPVMFVFNEATLTEDGRKAAQLLLDYLRIKHFAKVSLTGHADERGTEALNMALSKERLDTVARFLKAGGFNGELELIPKGKSEPFTGVDRSQYALEDLYQLDRRVELIVTP